MPGRRHLDQTRRPGDSTITHRASRKPAGTDCGFHCQSFCKPAVFSNIFLNVAVIRLKRAASLWMDCDASPPYEAEFVGGNHKLRSVACLESGEDR